MKHDTHDAIKDAFDQIQASNALKESTKQAVLAQLTNKATAKQEQTRTNTISTDSLCAHVDGTTLHTPRKKRSHKSPSILQRRLIPLAACLILVLVAAFGGYQVYTTPAAAISIDINPSLELSVNRFDRVISVEAYNEDGQQLANSVDVINMDYEDALETILATNTVTTLLDEGELLSVSLACDDDSLANQMYANLEACTAQHQNSSCNRVDSNEVEEAHHQGLSFGKYQAYLDAHECDDSLTIEDAQHMTMRELHNISGTHNSEQASDHGNRSGNSQGHHGQHIDD